MWAQCSLKMQAEMEELLQKMKAHKAKLLKLKASMEAPVEASGEGSSSSPCTHQSGKQNRDHASEIGLLCSLVSSSD